MDENEIIGMKEHKEGVIPKSVPVLSTKSILHKMAVDRELRLSTKP